MRKLLIVLIAAVSLGGCAALQRDFATFQTAIGAVEGSVVSQKTVFVAANAFDALKVTATNYLRLPKCGPGTGPVCRDPRAVAAITPAVRSGTIVRNRLVAAARAAGDQPIAVSADWNTFKSIAATLREVLAQYGVTVPGV